MIVLAIRWLLGLVFAFSGLAKLVPGFPNTIGPTSLEEWLAPHGLGLFARFVAFSEVGCGLLLLTRRFATLGAVMLLPLLTSILVVTVSLQWRGTPFVNAGLLVLNVALLLYDYPKLAPILGERTSDSSLREQVAANRSKLLWLAGLGLALLGIGLVRHDLANDTLIAILVPVLLVLVVIDWRSSSGTAPS